MDWVRVDWVRLDWPFGRDGLLDSSVLDWSRPAWLGLALSIVLARVEKGNAQRTS